MSHVTFILSLLTACFTSVPSNLSLALRHFTNVAHPPLPCQSRLGSSASYTWYDHNLPVLILDALASSLVHFSPLSSYLIEFQIPLCLLLYKLSYLLPHHHFDGYLLAPALMASSLNQHHHLAWYSILLPTTEQLTLKIQMKTPVFSCLPNKDKDPYTTQGPPWIGSNQPFCLFSCSLRFQIPKWAL